MSNNTSEEFNNSLILLPKSAPQIYHDLLNCRPGVVLLIKPQHTVSLTLAGISMFFATVIFSLYLFFDYNSLEQDLNAAAVQYIVLNFSVILMGLFLFTAIIRSLFEALTLYEFDSTKVTIRFLLKPKKKTEILYSEIRHVFSRGFLTRNLSFNKNSNINIVTNANKLYVLRSVIESQFLIQVLVNIAAKNQNKSPRSIALLPEIDQYLTEQGKIPPP